MRIQRQPGNQTDIEYYWLIERTPLVLAHIVQNITNMCFIFSIATTRNTNATKHNQLFLFD